MKKIILNIVTLFIASASVAGNNEKEVKSEITDVSVFLNGAMVTRSGTVTLPAGNTMLIFKGVSSKISKQTIKADISNNVKVLAVEYVTKTFTTGKQDSLRIKILKDTVGGISKEIRKIDYQVAVYEAEKKTIEQNNILVKGNGPNNMQVAELQKLSDL